MAGAGYKLFNTGDVLTAAQVNTYLMEQTVMVFADAAARTTALTGVVSEGMISYLKDTNAVEVYNGSAWVSSDDPNAIQNTIVDAKGDLITATASDVPARLAVGNNGETLVADSSATTGLRWQGDYAAGKNKIINGDFAINQRNFTSTTTSQDVGFDRWRLIAADGTVTYSAQTFTAGTAPVSGYESTNFARMVTTGQTLASANAALTNRIEDVRTFAGQTVTVSFWAKAASGTPKIALELAQNFGAGGSAQVNTYGGQVTLSTSWARYSVTFTGASVVPSISGKTIGTSSFLASNFFFSCGSDLNSRTGSLGIQSNTFDIWGVQIEAGNTATAFQTATGTLAGELAACQRYYFRITPGGNYNRFSMAQALSATAANAIVQFPVAMRVAPTALEQSGTASHYAVSNSTYGALLALTAVPAFDRANNYNASVSITCSTGLTAGHATQFVDNNTSSAYLGWSAEL